MSYRIEYRYSALKIPGALVSDGVDRFAVCIEGGDNNCFESGAGNARRSRSWGVDFIGTKEEILERSCVFAASCESGMLKPMGRVCTAESYIGRIRKLIDNAKDIDDYNWQDCRISLRYFCEIGSADDLFLSSLPLVRHEQNSFTCDSKNSACFKFREKDRNDYKTFFDVYPIIHHDQAAWKFAECSGPN